MKEAQEAQRQITTLASFSSLSLSLHLQNLRPIHISNSALYQSSGLSFFPTSTLDEWQVHIKNMTKLTDQDPNVEISIIAFLDLDDFNMDLIDNVLLPVLTGSDALPDLPHLRSRVGQNPTGVLITSLVRELIPLNEKQRIVVEKVLSEILSCTQYAYDASRRKQTLLYIGGEGGVGKSQIIKATATAMDLIYRKNEIILMALIGAAADVIGGSTYYMSLRISLN